MKHLCIDIGGTRIKSAILDDLIPPEQLLDTKVHNFSSCGWINSSLPNLFASEWPGLFYEIYSSDEIDAIAVSVATKVDASGRIIGGYWRGRGVAEHSRTDIEYITGKPVRILNDGISWLIGFKLVLSRMVKKPLNYPALCVGLGTGVALACAVDSSSVSSIEISDSSDVKFSRIRKYAKDEFKASWMVHEILGREFFDDFVNKRNPTWPYVEVRKQFTKRLVALLTDYSESIGEYKTLCVGGGNAVFVSKSTLEGHCKADIVIANDLLPLSPDMIPLIGLLNAQPAY